MAIPAKQDLDAMKALRTLFGLAKNIPGAKLFQPAPNAAAQQEGPAKVEADNKAKAPQLQQAAQQPRVFSPSARQERPGEFIASFRNPKAAPAKEDLDALETLRAFSGFDKNIPGGTLFQPASNKAKAQQEEAAKVEADNKAKAQQAADLDARRSSPTGSRQMTWEEYLKLDPSSKAAVDFNGKLQTALAMDEELKTLLDKDRSGDITLAEAGDEANKMAGYRTAYKKVFGKDTDDATTKFAPNTLALLNTLEVDDHRGTLEEYLTGSGYITETDMKAGRHITHGEGSVPVQYQEARNEQVAKLTSGMERLNQVLSRGRVMLGDTRARASASEPLDDATARNFQHKMTAGLSDPNASTKIKMTGDSTRFNPTQGLDFSDLVTPAEQLRLMEMTSTLSSMAQPGSGVTLEMARDPKFAKKAVEAKGWSLEDWLAFLDDKHGPASGSAPGPSTDLNGLIGLNG